MSSKLPLVVKILKKPQSFGKMGLIMEELLRYILRALKSWACQRFSAFMSAGLIGDNMGTGDI